MKERRRGFCGIIVIMFIMFLAPLIITMGSAYLMVDKMAEIEHKKSQERYHIVGTIKSCETKTIEETVRHFDDEPAIVTKRTVTTVEFDDGRKKDFPGVPDCEIPSGKRLDMTYDGNGRILSVSESK